MSRRTLLYAFTAALALCGQYIAGLSLAAIENAGLYDFSVQDESRHLAGITLATVLAAQFVFILCSVILSRAKNFTMFLAVAAFSFAVVQYLYQVAVVQCGLYGGCF